MKGHSNCWSSPFRTESEGIKPRIWFPFPCEETWGTSNGSNWAVVRCCLIVKIEKIKINIIVKNYFTWRKRRWTKSLFWRSNETIIRGVKSTCSIVSAGNPSKQIKGTTLGKFGKESKTKSWRKLTILWFDQRKKPDLYNYPMHKRFLQFVAQRINYHWSGEIGKGKGVWMFPESMILCFQEAISIGSYLNGWS